MMEIQMWDFPLAVLILLGIGIKLAGGSQRAIQAFLIAANIALAYFSFSIGFKATAVAFAVSALVATYFAWQANDQR